MKTYEHFATTLKALLGDDQAVRINAAGFMPLSVEAIGRSGEGRQLIAISHTSVQDGDLMRDPELVFEIVEVDEYRVAEPISIRNDCMAMYQEVYDYDDSGRRVGMYPRRKKEVRDFARMWFRNLKHQGFLDRDAKREVLA